MTTTQTPAPTFTVIELWYFYASTTFEYVCRLDQDGKVPARFHGPFESKSEAVQEYMTWKLEHMETDEDQSD